MGSFGIFFLCLTFFYLLYYAVMILMDIYGKKARQTDGVEEFKVGGGAGTVENPDQVLEREDGGYEIKGHGDEIPVAYPVEQSMSTSETLSEDSNGEFSKSPIHEVSSYDEMLSVKSEGKAITKEFQEEYNEEEMFEASLEPMDSSRKLFCHIITTI
jgi:hypothetical protein